MKIYSVYDAEFVRYGRVHSGIESAVLLREMEKIPLPEIGTAYEPSIAALETCEAFADYRASVFGGMPGQLGMCWGRNTKLNCLEYHRDSEFNLGLGDFILLLAKQDEIENGVLDTAKVKAFRAPAGVLVEVYATTLHYAPCHTDKETGFRVLVALPRGTNTAKPALRGVSPEDKYLAACNKWLLAHPESAEAKSGAVIALRGVAGLNAAEHLRSLYPACRILWCSDVDFSLHAFRLRVDHFLLEPVTEEAFRQGLSVWFEKTPPAGI